MTLDVLSIKNLEVRCIVGVYPSERDTPQPLLVDVDLHLDTRAAARSESLSATVDYARAAGELRFLLDSSRFRLLETAAEALARWLLARSSADVVRVKLTKTEALGNGALASLEIVRKAREVAFEIEARPFGHVDVIHVSSECGIYRVRIAAGKSIPAHVHRTVDEHELVLSDRLLLQRQPVARGTAHHWPKDLPRRYDNPSDMEQMLLRVDRLPVLAHDAVEVAEPAVLTLPPSSSYAPHALKDS